MLYEIVGFEEVEKFRLPKELKNRLITNPDLHEDNLAIELRDSLGKSNLYTLLITSKYDTYVGKKWSYWANQHLVRLQRANTL